MTTPTTAQLLQSASALPGTWKLPRGRAITLRPVTDGILRVAHGRVWATVDGPHGGRLEEAGDHFLEIGRSMFVRAGQRVVIESWTATGASYFAWDPVLAPVTMPRPRLSFAGVLQPLADLRAALAMAARALGQLAGALVRLAWDVAQGGRAGATKARAPGLIA